MAKTPKQQEPAPVAEDFDDRIPCDVNVDTIEKARKHLLGRLRHLVLTNIYSTGDPGLIARTVQDIKALDMIRPTLGDITLPEPPKPLSPEEARAEQAAAHERHKRDEERENVSR